MTVVAMKEIGEVAISDSREGGKDYLLRPSLSAMMGLGERVIDRMSDGGGCTLSFTWDSYRSKGAA